MVVGVRFRRANQTTTLAQSLNATADHERALADHACDQAPLPKLLHRAANSLIRNAPLLGQDPHHQPPSSPTPGTTWTPVTEEQLTGAPDPDVTTAATAAGPILIAPDRGLGNIRAYPPGTHAGTIVLRLADQSATTVTKAIGDLASAPDLENLAGAVTVTVTQRGCLGDPKWPAPRQNGHYVAGYL